MEEVWNPQKFLPRAGRPAKLSNWGEKGLGQEGDQEANGHSVRASEFLCVDGRTIQKDNNLCSTPPIRPLWYSGSQKPLLSKRHMTARLELEARLLEDSNIGNKILWSDETKIDHFGLNSKHHV